MPLAFLALAAAVFLGTQISSVKRAAQTMTWQRGNLDLQVEGVNKAKVQLDGLIKQRGESVKQAAQVQEQFTTFFKDVVELAKTDEDTRKVVEKWQIQVQKPSASEPGEPDAKKE